MKTTNQKLPAPSDFYDAQSQLLAQNHLAASQVAAQLLSETEKLAGYPIRVTFDDDADPWEGPGVKLAWESGCGQHVVMCRREPERLQPFGLASALLRIQTESEARSAGRSRIPTVSPLQRSELVSLFAPLEAQRLAADGGWITLNPHPEDIALEPLRLLLASAPYMLVDARLHERYPVLRPAQFLSRSASFLKDWQAREGLTVIQPLQKLRERIVTALDGLQGLFLDGLFGGVTDFAARYHDLDGFHLSQKLWQQWEYRFPGMRPGDEFAVIDDFAEILGLSGRFGWIKIPSGSSGNQQQLRQQDATELGGNNSKLNT